jgi:hypothetical protein
MRHHLTLALLAAICAAGLARAEYIVIIANLSPKSPGTMIGGATGMKGGAIGMPGGALGQFGAAGALGPKGGAIGGPGGALGAKGGAVGFPGGAAGFKGGAIGGPGGALGAKGGPPMGGFNIGGLNKGGPPMGGANVGGANIGWANIGGGNMGFPPMGGGTPKGNDPNAIDDTSALVIAVLEVSPLTAGNAAVMFESQGKAVNFRHNLVPNGSILLAKQTDLYTARLLTKADGKLLPTVASRFKAEKERTFSNKDKTGAEAVQKLAKFALELGLIDEFEATMDELEKLDKGNPKAAAYRKVKDALTKPAGKPDLAPWKMKVLDGYKPAELPGSRFTLLHTLASDDAPAVKTTVARLDRGMKAYYYWWAFREMPLPVPEKRLVSVLMDSADDFTRLDRQAATGPVIADSFHSQHSGLAVFLNARRDAPYHNLEENAKAHWTNGWHRTEILHQKQGNTRGVPRAQKPDLETILEVKTKALLLKALEMEWGRTATTHEVARELVFASGLLPRGVQAPEWALFGIGSFFETPLQSPWQGVGVGSPYWWPRFKDYLDAGAYGEMKEGPNKIKAQTRLLQEVVTGELFRPRPSPVGEKEEDLRKRQQSELRHARAAAWALMYYLMQTNLQGVRDFFAELARQPRDIALDGPVVLECFAKAFKCWDKEKSRVDMVRFEQLADRWLSFARDVKIDAASLHKQIRDAYSLMAPPDKGPTTPGGGVIPPGGFPPGGGIIPPGGGPPGGGIMPPGGGGGLAPR